MLRLRTFGGLWLERDGGRLEGNAPRRSALLAILAATGDRGASRDRLLVYLWPDATEERARHNLSQIIYSINRQLGAEIIGTSGADIRLVGPVSSDVGDFLAAIGTGEIRKAVELYQGPFLEGFILSDAAEFEEWASGERRRLELLAREAMEKVAATDPKGPDAIALWRRLADIDPLATRYTVALARSIAAAGDPGAAIKLLKVHQQRLRAETGAATPEDVTRLLGELAATPVPSRPTPVEAATPSEPLETVPVSTAKAPGPAESASTTAAAPERGPVGGAVASLRRSPKLLVAIVGLAVLIAVVLTRNVPAKTLTAGAMIVLADVENLTADSTLGPALSLAASVAFQQSPGFSLYPRTRLPESLRRLGRAIRDTVITETLARDIALREAGRAVAAISVATLEGRWILAGRIVEPTTGLPLAARRETVDGADRLLEGLDRLTRWMRGQLGEVDWRRAPQLPLVTTASLPALKAFAEGEQALRRGDYERVEPAIERALAADTGFAAARALLGNYFLFRNLIPEALRWLREAEARASRLTEPEQLVVSISLARAEGHRDRVVTAAAALATRFPSTASWVAYAEALRDVNRYPEALEAVRQSLALDSTFAPALISQAISLRAMGDTRGAIDTYWRLWRADSSHLLRDFYNQQWGGAYVDLGAFAQAESVFRRMLPLDATRRARALRSLAYLDLYRGRYAAAIEQLREAVALYTRPGLSAYRDWLLIADVELTRGRLTEANAALDRALAIVPTPVVPAAFLALAGHQLIRADRLGDARFVFDTLAARAAQRPDHPMDQEARAVLESELALARGQAAEAKRLLGSRRLTDLWAQGTTTRIEANAATGLLDSALVDARALVDSIQFGIEGQQDGFRAFGRLARVAEAAGDSATARAAYSALLERWKDGDADLPLIVQARRELARLQRGANR